MIGTIRKHSKWLWGVIIAATIITFVFWGTNPGGGNAGGGGMTGNYGSIDGQKVTPVAYWAMKNEVEIFYWFRTGQWPERNPDFSEKDLQFQIYERLWLVQEAEKLGIHIGTDAVATEAKNILGSPGLQHMFGLNGQSVPWDAFIKNVLQPKGLAAGDFENFVRHDMMIGQLRSAMGIAGDLLTPEEIKALYQQQYQERSAQIVFFSASNYLDSVPLTPASVDLFYSNYMAQYRLPDRVVVSYVEFPVTNFMAEAQGQLTNLSEQVEALFSRYGTNAFPDAKTPDEARAKIREFLLRQQALADAKQKADDFANITFNMDPARPQNLATVAKQKGLAVQVTEPFSKDYGPKEINVPASFTKTAFGLTDDEPLAGPIIGEDAVYVIALDKQLPSEIPPLSRIRDRVAHDYELHEATLLAQKAGTNFVVKLQINLALGKSFSSICSTAGLHAETLPAFSRATSDLPELGERASVENVVATTFGTEIHHASDFMPTTDGGFIVYVKSELPLDTAAMNANLPRFAAAVRAQQENAAFTTWLQLAGTRALRNTPAISGQ